MICKDVLSHFILDFLSYLLARIIFSENDSIKDKMICLLELLVFIYHYAVFSCTSDESNSYKFSRCCLFMHHFGHASGILT